MTLDVTLNQEGTNPMSKAPEAGFTASTTINRSDFGVDKYVPMVSDQIVISIEAEAGAAQ
ncbi:MAG: YceI family protein [Asticcacaulis sp.]